MGTTRVTRHINAPRDAVYRALLDAHAIKTCKVPNGMTSRVHEFEVRGGGALSRLAHVRHPDRGRQDNGTY
jgi:uncharacterized protein YndB with AHSA1/START domain